MDRCTGHHDIIEILLKTVLNTIQSINLTTQTGLASQRFPYFQILKFQKIRQNFLDNVFFVNAHIL